jgi:hypothetical protein
LPAPEGGERNWADDVLQLFKSIPPKLEQAPADGEDVDVAFE